jgi:AcrR family transcriptional regulator
MGRPARHHVRSILDSAKQVSAAVGPQKLTIAAVADAAGAPIGSIYHRYASRDDILAALWLDLVEGFQARFLAHLEGVTPSPRPGRGPVRVLLGPAAAIRPGG